MILQPNQEAAGSIVTDSDIGQLLGMDELFASVFNQYGPPPAWSRPPGFISLSKIILDQQVVRQQLTGIKGVGDWTADVYLMFCLKAKDVFPIGDMALRNTICELSNAKTSEEMIALAENWKPLRSLATFFLWHHYLRKRNRS